MQSKKQSYTGKQIIIEFSKNLIAITMAKSIENLS